MSLSYVGLNENLKDLKAAVLSTEERVVGLCWEHLKPKGPKQRKWLQCHGCLSTFLDGPKPRTKNHKFEP